MQGSLPLPPTTVKVPRRRGSGSSAYFAGGDAGWISLRLVITLSISP